MKNELKMWNERGVFLQEKEIGSPPLLTKEEIENKALQLHQSGLNGAQAVLQTFMECGLIKNMPELINMTSAWKGGIAGDTCSAYAAGTLLIGLYGQEKAEKLQVFDRWFKDQFGSISCPTITDKVGGRPSKAQKSFCDTLTARAAGVLFELISDKI